MANEKEFYLAMKKRIWDGATESEICAEFKVSGPTVARIKAGLTRAHIPWPDGSIGSLPSTRRGVIASERAQRPRAQHASLPAPALSNPLASSPEQFLKDFKPRVVKGNSEELRQRIAREKESKPD